MPIMHTVALNALLLSISNIVQNLYKLSNSVP